MLKKHLRRKCTDYPPEWWLQCLVDTIQRRTRPQNLIKMKLLLSRNYLAYHDGQWILVELISWIRSPCYQDIKRHQEKAASNKYITSLHSSIISPSSRCTLIPKNRTYNQHGSMETRWGHSKTNTWNLRKNYHPLICHLSHTVYQWLQQPTFIPHMRKIR